MNVSDHLPDVGYGLGSALASRLSFPSCVQGVGQLLPAPEDESSENLAADQPAGVPVSAVGSADDANFSVRL